LSLLPQTLPISKNTVDDSDPENHSLAVLSKISLSQCCRPKSIGKRASNREARSRM
jgi:hypothetical protein